MPTQSIRQPSIHTTPKMNNRQLNSLTSMILWLIVAIVMLVTCACHNSKQIQNTESLDLSRINTSALTWILCDTIFGQQLIPVLNGLPISTDVGSMSVGASKNTGFKPTMIDNDTSYPIYPTLVRHTTIKATGRDTTTMQQKQTNQQSQQTHETQRSWLDIIARLIIACLVCFLLLHILIKK